MRIFRETAAALAILTVSACGAGEAPAEDPPVTAEADTPPPLELLFPAWYESVQPFRVIGDIYYVGSKGLGMYFIPTDDGHIIIDGGLPENAEDILQHIRTLGYDPEDVKILLNTHAHLDHSGGLARLKEATGARLIASEGDRSALEGGFYLGSEDTAYLNTPPIHVDEVIGDGGQVELGGITLTATITPGHTRGCTSWSLTAEEEGETYDVMIFCSATVASNRLAPNPQYHGIVEDYQATFDRTREWRPDVFLANHAEFFGLWDKREAQLNGDALAFVDREAFPAYIEYMEEDFHKKLAAQSGRE